VTDGSIPVLAASDPRPELALAGRAERLVAAIIDGLMVLAVILPAIYAGGYFDAIARGGSPAFGEQLLWSALGFAVFVAVHGYPLSRYGQTWGKRLFKMKIVDLRGNKPDLPHLLWLRYGTTQLFSLVPFLGRLYTLVDVLFIFTKDRRCIHDLLAGTRVVRDE